MNKTLEKILEDELFENQTFEVEGNLQIKHTSEGTKMPITLVGNSYQKVTEQGKNLCDLTKAKLQTSSKNDKVINNANSITIIPKNELIHNYVKYFFDLDITQYLGGKLYLKVDKSRDNSFASLATFKDDGTKVDESVSQILDIPAETVATQIGIYFYASNGESAIDLPVTFSDIMVSLEDIEYEPFVPDSPSPEYPSEIRNCGDNVNLFDESAWKLTDIDGDKEILKFSGYYIANIGDKLGNPLDLLTDCSILKKGEAYTVSGNFKVNMYYVSVAVMYEDFSMDQYLITNKPEYNYSSYTFTISKEKTPIHLYLVAGSPNNYNFVEKNTLKLEKGTKATSWSPYKCGSMEIKVTDDAEEQSITFPAKERTSISQRRLFSR